MNLLTTLPVAVAAVFVALGAAKLLAAPAMQTRAAQVGFTVDAYRGIGAFELAGAAGLLVGMVVPALQLAASAGLLLLLLGAVIAHSRAGDGAKDSAPAAVLAVLVAVVLALAAGALR